MASNLPGQGVNWSAFQDISRAHLQGGMAYAEGIGKALGSLASGIDTMFERKQKAKLAADQREHELSLQSRKSEADIEISKIKQAGDDQWRARQGAINLRLDALKMDDQLFEQDMSMSKVNMDALNRQLAQAQEEIDSAARRGPEWITGQMMTRRNELAERVRLAGLDMQDKYVNYRKQREAKSNSILGDLSASMNPMQPGSPVVPGATDLGVLPTSQQAAQGSPQTTRRYMTQETHVGSDGSRISGTRIRNADMPPAPAPSVPMDALVGAPGEAGQGAPAGQPGPAQPAPAVQEDPYKEFARSPRLYAALTDADRASEAMLEQNMARIDLRSAAERQRVSESIDSMDRAVSTIDAEIAKREQQLEALSQVHGNNPTDAATAAIKKNGLEVERLRVKRMALIQRAGEARRSAEVRAQQIQFDDQQKKMAEVRLKAISDLQAYARISNMMSPENVTDSTANARMVEMSRLIDEDNYTFKQALNATRDMKVPELFDPADLRLDRATSEAARVNKRLDQEIALHRAGEEDVSEDVYTRDVRGMRWKDLGWPVVTKVIVDNMGGQKQREAIWGAMMKPEIGANPNFNPRAKGVSDSQRNQEIEKRLEAVRLLTFSMIDENQRRIKTPEDERRAQAYWGRRFMQMMDLEPVKGGRAQFVANPRYVRTRPAPGREEE